MTMIPNCREDSSYNYDFLDKDSKSFIDGFDYALEVITNMLCSDLKSYEGDLNAPIFEVEDGVPLPKTPHLMEILMENCEVIANCIDTAHEIERDELITSFIEHMDDEEYDKNRAMAIEINPCKYFDTRKFNITGVKEYPNE